MRWQLSKMEYELIAGGKDGTIGGRVTHKDLAGMAIAKGESRVGNKMRKAIRAAQETGTRVVGEPLLSPLLCGLECQGGCRALLVLHNKKHVNP